LQSMVAAKTPLSTKAQLGANMSAAAGPKGRDTGASTDASLRAEMLSYSRSRGLFAGVSFEARRCVRTTTPVRRSTDIRSRRERSCEEPATPFPTPAVVWSTCSRRKRPATRRLRRDRGPPVDLSLSAAWHSLPRRGAAACGCR
jgi:hypothetical protein